jgi:hypothetical protein
MRTLLSQATDDKDEATLATGMLLVSQLCQLAFSGRVTTASTSKTDQHNILQAAALLVQQL